ncbi:uncharacterized protein ColSpa_10323 [Colletotrichum spaethianum]|uniref:Uncharacterized protein n=1 Tax=Colletotrichum spaethianum TaxID=700344 RepID=A0AA37PDF2_9PEZI|nr:uncharacterized protein ColSpa_10323 [Colletotrichum spaethianum]GKT50142.1 hypothetical protein ColSpa_10323 [Colletotrichum spaethianum]
MSPAHFEDALKIDNVILDAHRHDSILSAEHCTFNGSGGRLNLAAHDNPLSRGVSRKLGVESAALCDETGEALKKHWGGDGKCRRIAGEKPKCRLH